MCQLLHLIILRVHTYVEKLPGFDWVIVSVIGYKHDPHMSEDNGRNFDESMFIIEQPWVFLCSVGSRDQAIGRGQ